MAGERRLFGEVAVELGFIDQQQLKNAVRTQRQLRKKRVGELLVELGALDAASLAVAVRKRGKSASPFGEFLLAAGSITAEQLVSALQIQEERRKKRLGEILVESGDLNEEQLGDILRELRIEDPAGI